MNMWLDHLMVDMAVKNQLIKENAYKGKRKKVLDSYIIKDKKRYRASLKTKKKYLYPGKDGNGYGEIVNGGGDYDSFWQKVFFKGEHWTEEEKREFIEDAWIYAKPSQYDCTGQIFTRAIDMFNVPNGVVVYIRSAIDV